MRGRLLRAPALVLPPTPAQAGDIALSRVPFVAVQAAKGTAIAR